ncbi:glucan endo-1,3-beta-D-glucosidase [[Candida] zeylanoides]
MVSKLAALLMAGKVLADYTVTHTNYITPDCFNNQLRSIASENEFAPAATGIPIVFVYGDAASSASSHSLVTSDVTYTVTSLSQTTQTVTSCSGGACVQTVKTTAVPHQLTLSTQVTYTATSSATDVAYTATSSATDVVGSSSRAAPPFSSSSSSKARSTIYDTSYFTKSVERNATITRSAPTTTITLYTAITTPKALNETSTSIETITQTQRDPLITQVPVSSSRNITINTSDLSSGITLSSPIANVSTRANSSVPARSSLATNGTSLAAQSRAPASANTTETTAPARTSAASVQTTADAVPGSNSTSATRYWNSSALISTATSSTAASSTLTGTSLTSASLNSTGSEGPSSTAGSLSSSSTFSSSSSSTFSSSSSSTFSSSSVLSSGPSSGPSSSLSSSFGSASGSSSSSSSSTSLSLTSSKPSSSSSVSSAPTTPISNAVSNGYTGDAFVPVGTSEPPAVFAREDLPLAIPVGVDNEGVPYGTNKFYANLFLGDQTDMIWTYPYGFYWKKQDYYGFGVQHTNASKRVFGSQDTNNPQFDSYYFNPTNNAELIISATSLTSSANMIVTEGKDMSVKVALSASAALGRDYVEIPVVQGMGFATAIYHGDTTPLLNSLEGVATLAQEASAALPPSVLKFRATLFNGVQWLVYVTLPATSKRSVFTFDVTSPYALTGSSAIDGLIVQLAVAPEAGQDGFYDQAAGLYVTSASVQGSVIDGTAATYSFSYVTSGTSSSGSPLVFALPHHMDSMTTATLQADTGITLDSTTKGPMRAFLTSTITLAEQLHPEVQFLPWAQTMQGPISYSAKQLQLLAQVANDELAVDIASTVSGMDSNYFSGKVLDKYAYILLVVNDIIKDKAVAQATLADLKAAFQPFIDNQQYYPLMYDTRFGGVTSTASQNGDTGADYGSGYYNDHHFHYGYFVHAAAIVGHVDQQYGGTWAMDNRDWVNALIRDVANPSTSDAHFPVSRMFDWFAGHSWAAGLFASGDGKNEESSSEDYNFSYGMKLWGSVIGDHAMESRGDLMLAVQARAMNQYMLYSRDNVVEPASFIGNRVSGILFDNKIAYTTYFGSPSTHPEYVHGIHMLPVTPASSLVRGPSYVQQEWDDQISTFIDGVDSGWTGILRLNQALYDADRAYEFFASPDWSPTHLDNGQSRTWSLAFAGAVA